MSGLSGEDRDYLENVCDEEGGMPCSLCERNQRLLALIDQLEKEVARLEKALQPAQDAWRAYDSARATSTKEDG